MQDANEEARPLLGEALANNRHEAASISSNSSKPWLARTAHHFKHYWPILRILEVALLWGAANYGAVPSYLDGLRSYTCAYVYSTRPGLLPSHPHPKLPHDRDRPCAVSGVESRVGVVVAVATMLSFVVSSISMLFYGPRLSRWGRKPMLLVSLASNIINYIPFALLPLGYPFGDIPSQLLISPAASMVVILLCSFLTGLTGFTGLFLCVMRVMIVDVAPPTRRAVALNWLISATLCGAFFGPLLAAWALDTSVKARTRLMRQHLLSVPSPSVFELPSDPTPPPIPGTPQTLSKHGNPAALVACCWVFFLAIVWVVLVVPETQPATVAESVEDSASASDVRDGSNMGSYQSRDSVAVSSSRLRAHKALGPLVIYLPQVTQDGHKDYRLTLLALAGAFANIGTNALSYVAVFAGYKFDFTPDAIGLLLGLIGATRAVWLIFAIPLLVVFFERTIHKPRQIASLSAQQLETLAKAGLQDPNLKQADILGNEEPEDHARPEPLAAGEPLPASAAPAETISAVVLWRASVDIAVAKISYFADIVGYLVVFISAGFSNAAAMISGTLFLSFGAGAGPAVTSAAIAIIQDQRRAGYRSLHPSLHASPTDDWLAALSISDNIVNGLSPILISVVYGLTIETALPSTCFLIPTLGYIFSFGLIARVKHR
ncbi:uncharacterized protein UMAG_11718 [Mycosarcoma maydis]|uniref:Uncharacterized protein n=1 Tax=Mycosarcoma maydis TaxID=5270 RepID=A0A0D1E0H6_MYCMD|nr:uncharacterized protein UMAG_11718 [Ustilago maydis 521]KIS69371.1 hypothetical protein UMAG_11718 [Ustilago maydis 521]|eukprot:XP_011389229.1 hypothetical protein UMAG_11718 [Ustilago maydis 521]